MLKLVVANDLERDKSPTECKVVPCVSGCHCTPDWCYVTNTRRRTANSQMLPEHLEAER